MADQRAQMIVGIVDPMAPGVALKPSYSTAIQLTTSDATPQSPTPTALLIATGGTLVITDQNNNVLTFAALAAGAVIPVRPTLVKATGTSAVVIGLY